MIGLLIAAALAGAGPSLSFPIPNQYQGNNDVTTHFIHLKAVTKNCGKPSSSKLTRLGCATIGQPEMWVINPCDWKESKNPTTYAHYLCHELAHTNGWVHEESTPPTH